DLAVSAERVGQDSPLAIRLDRPATLDINAARAFEVRADAPALLAREPASGAPTAAAWRLLEPFALTLESRLEASLARAALPSDWTEALDEFGLELDADLTATMRFAPGV